MVAEFPIQTDRFRLNNRKEGEIMTIEFVEKCTSIHCHAGIALSAQIRWTHNQDLGRLKYNWVNIVHKTNPHGIRTLGAMYKMLGGGGRRLSDSIWCNDLFSSAN